MKRLKKRKIKKRIYSWPVVIILSIIAFFFVLNTWDVYTKYVESRSNVAGLAESYERAEIREDQLQEKILHLQSEKGLEEEIREKFNVAKEGEQVIVILDPETPEEELVEEESNFIQRMWSRVWEVFR